ncbi:MtrAB system histidine kinase MtrB [Actinoalloteichus hymeniacidonis]|uniref:Sensor histidine kinase MtrB n=1 Tax=Actinoalloteichus hymeniacidonis TaxID=340345 RepID=A0AAC9HU07_9PSEU|nr:MtrAB system histidine kinase MtrB [Actinoalloteichus hymeniacidonis]AOS65438.1 signal transduction histidine kinase [Actinoalloteichus hymeniacidonis]
MVRWFLRTRRLARRRFAAFATLWRRSLQLRVVISTLALSSAVVFVLGMVLQAEITNRLLEGKRTAVQTQAYSSRDTVERLLVNVNPNRDDFEVSLSSTLNDLSSSDSTEDSTRPRAGVFEPVIIDGHGPARWEDDQIAVGRYEDVPQELRTQVEDGALSYQITTVVREHQAVRMLVIGIPVQTTNRYVQLYQLYPLTNEEQTIGVVQSTLILGGLAIVLLLAGVTNLVTRQVVRPVRQAAVVAERFAEGDLDDRMRVVGEDEVARLAESFNEMAASLQDQIHRLEEFGTLQRRFTSDVSHELRTPLTTVRMAADVLHASRDQFPMGLARSTELLVNELDRFESLLGDLLEISRHDAGVVDISAETVDLRSSVENALEAVRGLSTNVGASIEVNLPPHPVLTEIDSRRIERVLRNLLANAVDHCEGNPVVVTLAADRNAAAITVLDRGVGLRPGEEELVFNRFWRADPSRNRRTGGTGLGLAISLEDARLHGGMLDAWGEVGVGACFRLTLPRRIGEEVNGSPLPLPPIVEGRSIATEVEQTPPESTVGDSVADALRWQAADEETESSAQPPADPLHSAPTPPDEPDRQREADGWDDGRTTALGEGDSRS